MAYTSLREFAAAILPKYSGESTTGVIKSTVRIPILSSSIFHSAASSPLFHEAIRLSSRIPAKKQTVQPAGPIFAAQPLVRARSESLIQIPSFSISSEMGNICRRKYLFNLSDFYNKGSLLSYSESKIRKLSSSCITLISLPIVSHSFL